MAETIVREITCKSALNACGLPGFRYSMNPYRGCQHGCVYCYSPCVLREGRPWGGFVDVRVNIPTILAKELSRRERGEVWLGSVCDAYQPVEEKYGVTRMCLEQLAKAEMPVSLLTKSALCVRDFDLMKSFEDFDLGFSMAFASELVRRKIEPGASSVEQRIDAVSEAVRVGLQPWVFIAPIMPGITDRPGEIELLVGKLAEAGVRRVGFDPFRPRGGIWPRLRTFLQAHDPGLIETYKTIRSRPDYYAEVGQTIQRECMQNGITVAI
jgi:DNA repair photolyase